MFQEEEGITSNIVEGSGRTGVHQGRRNRRIPAGDGEEDGDIDIDLRVPETVLGARRKKGARWC
jgi:hypothetical protein